MRSARLARLAVLVLFSSAAMGGGFRREAVVISMDTVLCTQRHGVIAALSGSASPMAATCSEYVMTTSDVEYRIRPHKHEVLLPVGEPVKFRFTKDRLLVRPDDGDQDYEFDVISMELKTPAPKIAERAKSR
jgi:hypothetical protein